MEDDQQLSRLERIKNVDISKKGLKKRARRAEGVTIRHARRFIFKRLDKARDVQRHVIMWLIAVALLIGLSGVQLAWFREGYVASANYSGGVFAEGTVGAIDTLNPIYADSSSEEAISRLVFSRLLEYDSKGVLGPEIASGYSVDKAGTTYAFTIRDNIRWHDGTKLTVDDVLFTFELLQKGATRSALRGWDTVTIKKVDDKTISFTVSSIIAAFPHAIASVPILPKHTLESVSPSNLLESDFSKQPIGTGPFVVRLIQEVDPNKSEKVILLDSNPDYFKGRPQLDRFELHTYASTNDLAKALKNSEISGASGLESRQIENLADNKYSVVAQPVAGGVYTLFNTIKEPLNDKRVRKALQLSLDTGLVRKKLALEVPAMDYPLTNQQVATGITTKVDSINVARANELLDEAGYSVVDGVRTKGGKPLTLSMVTVQGEYEQILPTLVDQWKQIGVEVTTTVYDPTDVTQRFVQDILQARNYDILVYPITVGGDMDVYAYWHSSQANARSFNFSNYSNRISDDALNSARTRLEPDLRLRKYNTFVGQWVQDVPAIGLYQSVLYYAHASGTKTFSANNILISAPDRYSDVLYWTANEQSLYKTP